VTYIIYTDDVKYLLDDAKVIKNNDPKFGDIGAYHQISVSSDRVTIFQGRRHLILPSFIDESKIYHTVHTFEPSFMRQWIESHPSYSSLLLEIESKIAAKMPEYADTIKTVNAGHEMYPHNMYSMPGVLFQKYRSWLDWALHLVDLPDKDKVGSLLAERLFTIWMKHNEDKYPHECVKACCYDKVTGECINDTDGVA